MKAGFFHDHRFGRDATGLHYSNGNLPYPVLARYLRHFDRLVVVGRVAGVGGSTPTLASGDGVDMACLERPSRVPMTFGLGVARHVRNVMEKVDCAIIRLPSLIGLVACREAIRTGKPWMVEVVGCTWDALWNHGSLRGKAAALPFRFLNRHYIAKAPFALYVSEQFLQSRYPCHGQSIGCSDVLVEMPRREVLEKRLAHVELRRGERPVTLGIVGSLNHDYKGHATALRALSLLKASFPNLKLRCLGGGDPSRWRKRAAALGVAGNVEFSGTLPSGAPVLEWMDGLDLFLIPSLQEGLPRALVEAMTRALPVVGARTGGIPELIGAECIHPPRDHARLAARIRQILEHPEEMKAYCRRNWEKAREYAVGVLDERRNHFFERFKAFAVAFVA